MKKLNLGCGSNKIPGYIGVDVEKSCKPDLLHDFIKEPLPFKPCSIDEVVMFHVIEHLPKHVHTQVLLEIFRVLKLGKKIYITYPNFWECATRWKENQGGQKDFWHATMFGRQLYPSDFHVSAMDPDELDFKLREIGFTSVLSKPERDEPYNSITVAVRGPQLLMQNYEEQLSREFNQYKVKNESRPNKRKRST